MPRDAAPFLNFEAYSSAQLRGLYDLYDLPRSIFPLGQTGVGDSLGIEVATQAVIYFNHDAEMQRVLVNSSIAAFAQSLCLYQELLHQRSLVDLLDAIRHFDPLGVAEGTMWHAEASSED